MNKLAFFAVALLIAPLPAVSQQQTLGSQTPQAQGAQPGAAPSGTMENRASPAGHGQRAGDLLDRIARTGLRDRMESAIERVEDACGGDIEEYCGDVTPGGGRVAACMHAHADALSRRCRFTLFRTARNIRNAVENIADECWDNIKAQCGNEQNVGQCATQKSSSLSQNCQAVVAALQGIGQKIALLKDMPVYSSDNKDLGRVVEAVRGPDGKLQSVQIQIGRFLGLGDKVVTIPASEIREMADRIMLHINSDQVRAMPETKRPG